MISNTEYFNNIILVGNKLNIDLSFLPQKILKMIEELAIESNINAYLVGGAIRDAIVGTKAKDIDVAIEGDAIKFGEKLKDRIIILDTKKSVKFKTFTLFTKDNFRIDLNSTRSEIYPYPGALPEITLSNINDDLLRRDFTMNALAILISSENVTGILDPTAGYQDILDKKIRIIKENSFVEDPIRIFRCIRYSEILSFKIEEKTLQLMEKAIKADCLETVSRFRITNEIDKCYKAVVCRERLTQLFEKYGVEKYL